MDVRTASGTECSLLCVCEDHLDLLDALLTLSYAELCVIFFFLKEPYSLLIAVFFFFPFQPVIVQARLGVNG